MPQPVVKAKRQRSAASAAVLELPNRITWDDAVDAFLASKRGENLSPATLENYEWHLRGPRARAFLADHDIDAPSQLTAHLLTTFQRELLDSGVSASLAHAHHRVWKNAARYWRGRGWGVDADVLEVRGPRQPQVEPEFFTKDEEKRLMAAARSPRDRMLLEFLTWTGLRLREVCEVEVADVVDGPEGAYLRVRQGKGRKDRIVPLDTGAHSLSARLRRFVAHERPKTADTHLFLTSRRKDDGEYGPLSPRAVQILIHRLGNEAGVVAHPHKFRHTFGSRAIAAGVDPITLSRVMGHTTLAMTNRYVHFQRDNLLAAWRQRRD